MSGIPGPNGFPGPGPAPVIPGQGGFGTVSSVGLALGGSLAAQQIVGNSPITGAGNISLNWQAQNANLILGGPASGAAATPVFRSLVPADMSNGPPATSFTPTLSVPTIGDGVFTGPTVVTAQIRQMGPLIWFVLNISFTLTFTTASGQLSIGGWPVLPLNGLAGYVNYAVSPAVAAPYSPYFGTFQNQLLVATIYATGQAGNFWGPGFGLVSGTSYRVQAGGVYITP